MFTHRSIEWSRGEAGKTVVASSDSRGSGPNSGVEPRQWLLLFRLPAGQGRSRRDDRNADNCLTGCTGTRPPIIVDVANPTGAAPVNDPMPTFLYHWVRDGT